MPDLPQRVLHVFNYAWPRIDGYVVRSMGLVMAQQRHLGIEVAVAVSPFAPLAKATDPNFRSELWGPGLQLEARDYAEHADGIEGVLRPFERPPLGLAPFSFPTYRRELRSIIRRLEPDLVHAHHPHYNAAPAREAAAALGVPFVYELRCFNGDYDLDDDSAYFRARGRWLNALEYRLCRQVGTLVTISDGLKDRIVREAGVPEERVFVVRNSVNTELFTPPETPRPTGETLRVGYATTFEQMEGLDIFVKAAARAAQHLRAQGRRLEVTIAGTGRDWDRIADLVYNLGLEDTVHLPGFVPYGQMPDFYHGLDLFVVPRRHAIVASDTTPLKPLEALASGLPLLVSNLPAMRELLAERSDVRFFEPNRDALADALVRFAEAPWAGTGEIEDRSWKREIHKYEAVYTHALAAHRSSGRTATDAESARPLPVRAAKWALRQAADRGLGPLRSLDRHIVVCGFPRSGSTLLQLIAGLCVEDVMTFDEEVDALWAARSALRRHAFMLTKMPSDIAHVDAVRAYYRAHPGRAHFVLTVRDPRDVLTSTHDAYPDARGYYVSPERWQAVYDAVRRHHDAADVTLARYEDLVGCPDRVQQDLTDALGWHVRHPFDRYYQVAQADGLRRDSMTEGALGGFRPLDASGLARWQRPEHRDRVREMLAALPDLPEALIELGYETDKAWLDDLEVTA